MADDVRVWERFDRWNAAIAEVIFSADVAGQPVYLDLDEDALEKIGLCAEPDAGDRTRALVDASLATLALDSTPSEVLKGHLDRLDLWSKGDRFDPPPVLALLAVLSLAAEQMRQSDAMMANNFYGRLGEVAGLTEDQKERFTNAYRKKVRGRYVSRILWESLNDWLEINEGRIGNPTAHPLGHEHIGWALSQALVRQVDREKFVDLFLTFGLSANGIISTSEMATLIDEWISRRPCPASNHIERLWTKEPLTRFPIADNARIELRSWEGDSRGGRSSKISREIDSVRLRAQIASFPSERMILSLLLPAQKDADSEEIDVLDLSGSAIGQLWVTPIASGWMGISSMDEVDQVSLLVGEISLRRDGVDRPLRRRPRRLVPLLWDDMLASYVESERVQLGERTLLLCKSEIASKLSSLLDLCARPGFHRLEDINGLPLGWTAFRDVQISSSIPREEFDGVGADFFPLQPMAVSQVQLVGGFKLPGHQPKWHLSSLPELSASSENADVLHATIRCTRSFNDVAQEEVTLQSDGSILLWDLRSLDLSDGDYEIEVHSGRTLIGSQVLRVRSSDSPALITTPSAVEVEMDPLSELFPFGATRTATANGFEIAPKLQISSITPMGPIPELPKWWETRSDPVAAKEAERSISFPEASSDSCLRTGAHLWRLPTAGPGENQGGYHDGVCRYCGLVKAFPKGFRQAKRRSQSNAPVAPRLRVSELPRIRTDLQTSWSDAFDAVCHVGSGSVSALERIASSIDPGGSLADSFVRKLEMLGHINVERSSITLRPVTWTVTGSSIVALESGGWQLVGFRNPRLINSMNRSVARFDGAVEVHNLSDAPPQLLIVGIDPSQVFRLALEIGRNAGLEVSVIESPVRALCEALPSLAQCRKNLPRTSVITATTYEKWESHTARFSRIESASSLGAFRLTSGSRTYIYRAGDDLARMSATLGDARIVKYLAALDSGLSLVGYSAESRSLYVPLGADLPGVYGRAATMCSGKPPIEDLNQRILEYVDVPPDVASHLSFLLAN